MPEPEATPIEEICDALAFLGDIDYVALEPGEYAILLGDDLLVIVTEPS